MSIPNTLLPTTCDIYRPFGAGSPTHSNVPCRLAADLNRGKSNASILSWTHTLTLPPTADILDGVTRFAGANTILYADGDEVRVPSGASSPRFVVVWVESVDVGTPNEYKRAYLMRDTA